MCPSICCSQAEGEEERRAETVPSAEEAPFEKIVVQARESVRRRYGRSHRGFWFYYRKKIYYFHGLRETAAVE